MEEINLSDITMNGESLQPTEATQSQGAVEEQPQNDQQVEPETESNWQKKLQVQKKHLMMTLILQIQKQWKKSLLMMM